MESSEGTSSNHLSTYDTLKMVLSRLEAVYLQNKQLTEEVARLRTTIDYLKPAANNGRAITRVQTVANINKPPTSANKPPSNPVEPTKPSKDRITATTTASKPEYQKKEPPKKEPKTQPVNPPRPATGKKPTYYPPKTTEITKKQPNYVKNPPKKPATTVVPNHDNGKKIVGGAKKEYPKASTEVVQVTQPPETKVEYPLKLSSDSPEKHVYIEKLELSYVHEPVSAPAEEPIKEPVKEYVKEPEVIEPNA